MDWMPQAIRDGIFTVLFISGPLVLLAAALGLVIGIIQAATQVQEQTLGSAVKILGVFLALIVFGFYMFQYLKQYTSQTISRAFNLVPGLSSHPLPPKKLLKQPLKTDDETDHPLFSPEELAETAPAAGGGAETKAMGGEENIPEDAEVVEVPPEPVTDKLPVINYLLRPPSGLREAVIEQLAPENGDEAATTEEEKPEPARPAATTRAPVAATQPRPTATTRPTTTAPVSRPATTTAPVATRPIATRPATAPVTRASAPAASRPAPISTPRAAAKPVRVIEPSPIEEPAPIVVNAAPRNQELEASRSRARAALARIKSSIDEVKTEEGAATAE